MQNRIVLVALLAVIAAACGGETYTPTTKRTASTTTGEHTGILLNCQRDPSLTPIKGTLNKWKVVDPSGNVLFSDEDVPASNMRAVEWEWRRSKLFGSTIPHRALGKNPYEITMARDEYNDADKSYTCFVSDSTAAEIRAKMPKVMQLLNRWQIVVLVGKQGE